MGRLIVIVGSLLLPFLVYLLWLALSRRKAQLSAEGRLPAWQALPWTWLIIAGVLTEIPRARAALTAPAAKAAA